jgi:hypothetical protein
MNLKSYLKNSFSTLRNDEMNSFLGSSTLRKGEMNSFWGFSSLRKEFSKSYMSPLRKILIKIHCTNINHTCLF